MGKNKQRYKGGGIKILDPRRIDYTYTDNTFNINSLENGKYEEYKDED